MRKKQRYAPRHDKILEEQQAGYEAPAACATRFGRCWNRPVCFGMVDFTPLLLLKVHTSLTRERSIVSKSSFSTPVLSLTMLQ
jgi:hypothetical protein